VDDLERILAQPEEVEPSSGLTDTVMRAVLRESATPPPIRFPWFRFAAGMGSALLLVVATAVAVWLGGVPQPSAEVPAMWESWTVQAFGPPALALLLTFLTTRFTLRVARRGI
jgi:hypothetical protein